MNSIKISDLNVSDFEFMHQLTDEELLAINGGFPGLGDAVDWLKDQGEKVVSTAKQVLGVVTSPTTQKVINVITDWFKNHRTIYY